MLLHCRLEVLFSHFWSLTFAFILNSTIVYVTNNKQSVQQTLSKTYQQKKSGGVRTAKNDDTGVLFPAVPEAEQIDQKCIKKKEKNPLFRFSAMCEIKNYFPSIIQAKITKDTVCIILFVNVTPIQCLHSVGS